MADITMCVNKGCPLREKCYRFKAIPTNCQGWAMFSPDESGECEHFWETSDAGKLLKGENENK